MVAFVALLAVLTFFSNTIMNATIPKVMGSYATRGNLSYTNSATSTVVVDNQTKITGIEGRTIESVLVSNYDTVTEGDVIATLKDIEDSDELKELRTQLTTLQREAEYASRQPSSSEGYDTYNEAIEQAQQQLSEAQAQLASAQGKDATIAAAQRIIDSQSAAQVSLQASVDSASGTVEEIQSQIDEINAQITPLQNQIDVYVALGTPTPTPTPVGGVTTQTTEATSETDTTDETDENDESTATPTPAPSTSEMDSLCNTISELNAQKEQLQEQLEAAQSRLDENSAALAECQSAIESAQQTIEEANNLPSVSEAQSAVNSASRSLSSARTSLRDARINAGIEADQKQDEVNDRNANIEELETKIATLEEQMAQKEIKATADGYIYNLSISEGDTMEANQVIVTIIPESGEDRQCSVTFSFASSVAQTLNVGDELEVTSGWMQTCKITTIKPDPDNPREMRQVKCIITDGDAWPDEQITVRANRSNQDYDCVIASSAVNEDNSGTFVYLIQGSSSPLGDKYTVKRVSVTVEATDGAMSAISGDGLDGGMIVVRAEKPLEDGDRVRLEDYTSDSES